MFGVYPPAGVDNYWINIASYPTSGPPIGPSRILPVAPPWAQPFPFPLPLQTRWISAWPTFFSPPNTSVQNPAYTIFRKCFCLSPNFKNASLSFRVRADDNIQVWFNTILNTALAPTIGNWSPNLAPRVSLPSTPNWFRVGRNCIYVLLEDFGGHMGFDMEGTIQADGLAEQPAAGVAQTFPCACGDSIKHPQAAAAEEQQVIRQIATIAEERLSRRAAMQAARTPGTPFSRRETPWPQSRLLTSGWSRRPTE
ncbi:MAG TPA: hypothetical protein VHG08_04175 [Longimicrobium sp.]|nr:hypothetical protein [Longimicrobium sp.]